MRILIHSAPPEAPTGYSRVVEDTVPRLISMGHEVAISASGLVLSRMDQWKGVTVYPCTPYSDFGEDVIRGHVADFKADVTFTLLCTWILHPEAWRDLSVVHITPVDCMPMSKQDYAVITATGGLPAAVSKFGMKAMQARGLDPVYLPHGVDLSIFKPPSDRQALRFAAGVDDKFVIGLNFMNNDRQRKAIYHQFKAFAKFHGKHPDARLAVHAINVLPEGLNLYELADFLGIGEAVMWSDNYRLVTGQLDSGFMAMWYGAADVITNVGNEGFGLPFLEAQACGTPVVGPSWSTGPELVGAGWKVQGQEDWNRVHAAEWHQPYIHSIVRAYERAYREAAGQRIKARQFAARYDVDTVMRKHWVPLLATLG